VAFRRGDRDRTGAGRYVGTWVRAPAGGQDSLDRPPARPRSWSQIRSCYTTRRAAIARWLATCISRPGTVVTHTRDPDGG